MSGTLMYHTGSLGSLKAKLAEHHRRRSAAKGKPEPTCWVIFRAGEPSLQVWLVVPADKVPRLLPVLSALQVTEYSRETFPQTHLRVVK